MTDPAILIVEDEAIVAEDISKTLEGMGYAVLSTASSGEEAIKKAEEMKPDLVLMDIVLSGKMDGVEAAKHISAGLNIPVIFITAYSDKLTLDRAKVTGPFGYLIKPFREKELKMAIEIAIFKHETNEKLKESKGWLSTTLKSISDAVIATDLGGRVEFMNPIAQSLTGWSISEVHGKPLEDILTILIEEKDRAAGDLISEFYDWRTIKNNQAVLISRNKTKIPIDISSAPIRDDNENIIGTVMVFRDITYRKQAEEALWQSKEFSETVINSINDSISVINVNDYSIIDANKIFLTTYGLDKDSVTGEKCYEVTHNLTRPCSSPEDICPIAETLRTDKPSSVEHVHFPANDIQYVEITTSPIRDKNGNITRVVHVSRDITERKLAEQRLAKLNECFLNFGTNPDENINNLTAMCGELMGAECALYNRLDNGKLLTLGKWHTPPDYISVDDPEGHVCYDNIRRGTDEVLIIRNLPETVYARTDPNVKAYDLKTYIGKAVKFADSYIGSLCVLYRKDYEPTSDLKKLIGVLASAIGIEEKRKHVEEELKRANIELKKTDELKTQFLSVVSHELRTPITPMNAQLQMVLAGYFGEVSPKQKNSMDMVLRNLKRLDRLIGDVLDISKLESGVMKFNMAKSSLNEIVVNAVETMKIQAADKNLELILKEGNIPEVTVDKDRITQVIMNLLNNAIKFTDAGGAIEVELTGDTDHATVSVRDNGIGIKKEDIEKLFKPFQQVDSSESRKYEGNGLGLAICRKIVMYHGGNIGVESESGKGSRFYFTIPYKHEIRGGKAGSDLFEKIMANEA